MGGDFLNGAVIGGAAAAVVLMAMVLFRKPVKCAGCGAEQPKFRKPANGKQAMWGGTTCAGCGAELDAKGNLKTH